jgi:hypothetical protein
LRSAHGDTNGTLRRKLPVLIVAYCRAPELRNLLEMLREDHRKVYVAIDLAPQVLARENQEVKLCAESFRGSLLLEVLVNETQAGVKLGVPRAVEWVLGLEEECIVLEDDCVPTLSSLEYFDKMSKWLAGDIALVSGDSPWKSGEQANSSLSSYPLIWGWSTNRAQWKKISSNIGGKIPWIEVLTCLVRKPSRILPITYFLAAQIRVKRGKLQAWDCSVALTMLIKNLKCVIPNVRIIENRGDDRFAHHTKSKSALNRSPLKGISFASEKLMKDLKSGEKTDTAIQNRIYRMKYRHILSPAKALLIK